MTNGDAETTPHVAGLDGLRGVAATVVVLAHGFGIVAIPIALRRAVLHSPLLIAINGEAAVQIFFVLSGWVLAASLARPHEPRPWLQFWTRRVLRIHPPYVFGVLVAWCASAVAVPERAEPFMTSWTLRLASVHLEPAALLATLAFPGTARDQLPVGWTLEIEMIMSFLLPFLVVLARPARGMPLLVGATGLLFVPVFEAWYTIDFALGVVAYQERAALGRAFRAVPRAAVAILPCVAVTLLCAPYWFGWAQEVTGLPVGGYAALDIFVMGLGAVLLVLCVLEVPPLGRLFASRPLVFLGRISFSLYLLHRAVLHVIAPPLLTGTSVADLANVTFVGLIASIVVSVPSQRWIEMPSIALGKRLGRLLARRVAGRGGREEPQR